MKFVCFLIPILFLKFSAYGQSGIITTIAGNGKRISTGDGGPASTAGIYGPFGCAVDKSGHVYFSERFNHKVRRVNASGIINTVVGTGASGYSGDGGAATGAKLDNTYLLALDSSDNLFVAEVEGARVRKVEASSGIISTTIGNGIAGESGDGGMATAASVKYAISVCIDSKQNIFVLTGGNRIRRIDATSGIVSLYAGSDTLDGFAGDGGSATTAKFNQPYGICTDAEDNLYVADWGNGRIRKIDGKTGIIHTIAGTGSGSYNGEGVLATAANISPFCLVANKNDDIVFSDGFGYRLRRINLSTGLVSTIAGIGVNGSATDGSRADTSRVSFITGVAVDDCNNIYFSNRDSGRIQKITYSDGNQPAITIHKQTANALCYGFPVTFTAVTALAGSSPSFQWRVNGVNVGASSPTYTYTPANGDTVQCILTSSLYCVVNKRDTSNAVVVVYSLAPVTLSLSGLVAVKSGDTVTVTAAIGGTGLGAYTIVWKNRGLPFDTTTTPILKYVKTGGDDSITATLLSTSRGCYDSVVSGVHYVREKTGVNSFSNTHSITLHPNPVQDVLYVRGLSPEGGSIAIMDITGKLLLSAAGTAISMNHLSPGLYLVQVTDLRTGERVVERVMR